ncbi:MAG: hypothetical protein HQ500_03985 [Flavobacteriales bacterium]|nr:hypothetical protein [Flavobacteriales bacterium]
MSNNIKYIFLLLGFGLLWNTGLAQDDLFKLWPDSTLADANSARDVQYMNVEEKEAVYYMNLVRINPKLFSETFLKDYIKDHEIKRDKEVRGLVDELESMDGMGILRPSEQLTSFARQHAKDMGESGRTGHNSSSGAPFHKRIEPLQIKFAAINENCNYGNEKGVDAVIDLLIDRDVPNLGHRRNILDPEMELVGVAIEAHRRWRFNCVQDFGTKKK